MDTLLKITNKITALLIFVFLLQITAHAQSKGKIFGVVLDSETGEALIACNVVIKGTTTGSSTDMDGNYAIEIAPGVYDLIITYVSYADKTITGVEVKAGESTKIDILMLPETAMLEEIVVTAAAVKNTEGALLAKRQKSIAVSDAISSEFISNSGAGDAAAAMEKVTGASVVGGKYVYVRGLGDRYSSTHMNGIELPSTDPDKKSFHLDLVPSNLLDNITTLKTFTPDKPGNFSGGIVDINTKTFPEDLLVKFSASSAYNSQATFNSNFISDNSSGSDWRAVDNGQRDIPSPFLDPSLTIPNLVSARFNDSLAAVVNTTSKAFNPRMTPVNRTVPVDQSYSLAVGNQFKLLGKPLGYVASLSYSRSYQFYENGEVGRYNLTDPNSNELTPNQTYADASGTDEVNWGGLVNLQYRFTPSNKIGLNIFHTQSGINQGRFQNGLWQTELGFPQEGVYQERFNSVVGYTERRLTSYQLRGEHLFESFGNIKMDWNMSNAITTQEEPDVRFLTYYYAQLFAGGDTNRVVQASGFTDPSRIFRNLEETNRSAQFNIEVPFNLLTAQKSKFKFGANISEADREFRENWYFVSPDNRLFNQVDGDPNVFFDSSFMGVVDTTGSAARPRYVFGNVITDNTQLANNYDGLATITAYYGMLELPITERLKFIGGIRMEDATIEVASIDTSLGIGRIQNNDFLPSANLVYQVADNMNIRGAVTRTLARPNMRELATFSSFQFIGDFQLSGNPELQRTLITNYDLRWEWFPRPGEVFAISGFYKEMQNPIELGFVPGGIAANLILQYQNVDKAEIMGLEIEARKGLDILGDWAKYFNVGFNLSLVSSEINIPENDRIQRPDTTIRTRDLQGQSPYIINVNLGYDNFDKGFNAGFYFNVFGSRLSNVGFGTTPDVYERPRPQLDFTSSKRLTSNWTASLKIRNILNPDYLWEYNFKGNDYAFQRFQRGVTWSLGISYSL